MTITTPDKVALVTGGASGMGLAVANALAAQGTWHLHLLDIDPERGAQAAKDLHPHATFHQTDVSLYRDLATTFQAIFQRHGRLDFVFANAGVIEKTNFYARLPELSSSSSSSSLEGPPEPPDLRILDADLNGVVLTSYLALHYFRRSPGRGQGTSLVMTASCGGLYPSYYSPLYTAAKHGVVGFMRAIAPSYWQNDGIRVNAICPGIVQTNLVDPKGWATFPSHLFIAPETIATVVQMLIRPDTDRHTGTRTTTTSTTTEETGMVDARGTFLPATQAYGRAVEISGDKVYFREQPEFCDEDMRDVMSATVVEKQVGGVLDG